MIDSFNPHLNVQATSFLEEFPPLLAPVKLVLKNLKSHEEETEIKCSALSYTNISVADDLTKTQQHVVSTMLKKRKDLKEMNIINQMALQFFAYQKFQI
ncbi:unnamed protein product [Allacma fusca]|uniref:Uncharacterized protein n=1 Tax=Allacma fusca TaxID=39272 RepID=A0A8J2NWW6_9HEXA|nr:unnamed protein product [Allacma fusca]